MKLTGGLKRILSNDPSERILYDLEAVQEQADLRSLVQVVENLEPREEVGWVHVTDLGLKCDRLLAAAILGIEPPRSPLPVSTKRIYDNGTYMHLRYQTYFMALPPPYEVEVAKKLRRWPVVGEADVRVKHPDLGCWVIELKSMHSSMWRRLNAPRDEHYGQVNGYVHLSGGDWRGQIWYENKDTQSVKVFVCERDSKSWEEAWSRANRVGWDLLAGRLPKICSACLDRGFCESIKLDNLGALHEAARR